MPIVPDSEPIHIALTFDDGFWAPAYATMRSICVSTYRRADLVFHLCHGSLSPDHASDLQGIASEFGVEVIFYDLAKIQRFQAMIGRLPVSARLPAIVYARLVFESILPPEVQRVIYLDCDMMVLAPIEDLWGAELDGKPLGAVLDPWGKLIGSGRDLSEKRDLIDPAEPYFNSGLLVIDIKRWAAVKVWEKVEDLLAKGMTARLRYQQNVLNLIFRGQWQRLNDLWNVVDPHAAHVSLNPYNLHFTGKTRPWTLTARARGVGYARLYRHVMTNEMFYKFLHFRTRRRLARYLPFLRS